MTASEAEQTELNLDVAGYSTLVSLPLGTNAAEEALEHASSRGAMKPLAGKLADVRAARLRTKVGDLDRTLVVVESQELLEGQKRGIAAALKKAKSTRRSGEHQRLVHGSAVKTRTRAMTKNHRRIRAALADQGLGDVIENHDARCPMLGPRHRPGRRSMRRVRACVAAATTRCSLRRGVRRAGLQDASVPGRVRFGLLLARDRVRQRSRVRRARAMRERLQGVHVRTRAGQLHGRLRGPNARGLLRGQVPGPR